MSGTPNPLLKQWSDEDLISELSTRGYRITYSQSWFEDGSGAMLDRKAESMTIERNAAPNDDTEMVQQAFDAGEQLPPGTYRVSQPITVRNTAPEEKWLEVWDELREAHNWRIEDASKLASLADAVQKLYLLLEPASVRNRRQEQKP